MRSIELTGRIGKPLVTIHGTLDTLLPIGTDSDVYDPLVDAQAAAELHRYYRITDGTHTDGLYAAFPDRLRPLLPCARTAFDVLVAWVERGVRAPGGRHLPATVGDVLNTCTSEPARPAPPGTGRDRRGPDAGPQVG